MSSDKRYFLLGIFVTVVFGIIVNVLTPYFMNGLVAWFVLLGGSFIFLATIFKQEIRTWLAKRSLISKKKRIEELKKQIELFDKTCSETRNNPNKFILLVIRKYLIWTLILLFLLFSRISLGAIIRVFTGSPDTDFFDFYALAEAFIIFILIVNVFSMENKGSIFLERIADEEKGNKYREGIQGEILWLSTKIAEEDRIAQKVR